MVVAFGISWATWSPLLFDTSLSQKTSSLLYYAGVLGPAAAAAVCAGSSSGPASLVRRVRRWRVSPVWYAVAILLPFAIQAAAIGGAFLWRHQPLEIVFRPAALIMSTAALMLLLVPFEEIGWRGYALPVLQVEHTPLVSSMIIGGIWALWHFPLAWAPVGYQRSDSPWSYMGWFFVTILPVSCLATWLFNRTGGSILLVSLFHIAVNVADFLLLLPAATGRLIQSIAFIITAAVAGIIYRTDRLGRPARGA